MARRSRKRPYNEAHPPLNVAALSLGGARRESGAGGAQWNVRTVRGSAKTYICPGCQQPIPPQIEHVVAWREDHLFGADSALADRRHWHSSCWRARDRRGPTG